MGKLTETNMFLLLFARFLIAFLLLSIVKGIQMSRISSKARLLNYLSVEDMGDSPQDNFSKREEKKI